MVRKKKEGNNRILSIDLLRVIAIFLVIGFHLSYEFTLNSALRPIGFIGLSLFFIISGFVLTKKHPTLHKFSLKWFLKRYIKIVSVYYLALIAIVILFRTQTFSGNIGDLFLHFIFLDPLSKHAAYSIISPAWFLTPLIGLYILYPYLNKFVSKDFSFVVIAFLVMTVMRTLNGSYTSYSPLFFIGEFCFGIAFAHGKRLPALIVSAITIFINPVMFVPFVIFYVVYYIKFEYLPGGLLHFIGLNTFSLFLYHEAVIKLAFGKWHIYNLGLASAIVLLICVVVLTAYISKKIQDYFFNHKFFTGGLYDKSF